MTIFPAEGRVEPATSFNLTGIKPEIKLYLEQHGCTITEISGSVLVTYPEGTTRREIYPRTMYERYRVQLPDGVELREVSASYRGGENCLYVLEDPHARR